MTSTSAQHSYPLSPLQEGMLFHTLDAPRSGVYAQQLVGALHEELNCPAFRRAWRWVVGRHPVLRTGVDFAEYSGELLQRVHTTDAGLAVKEHDWRGTEAREREERLRRYLDADRRRGFELGAQTPLMRLALFRMDQVDYRFVWTCHHALLDGRSRLRVLTELFSAYESFCRGEEAARCERARPYRDYIEWLGMHGTDAEAERFWRRALRGFSAPTPLIVDTTSRSASPHDNGFATRGIRLSERSTAALKQLAAQHGLTLNTLVQGAWALLLSRYSGEDDIVFGATRACRTPEAHPDEVWVGLFINTLPVRVRLSSEEPLIPWLQKLRAQWDAAREYEHTPLLNVQAWSEVPAGTPLFASIVMFEHQTLQDALREQEGERWAGREFRLIQATNYPLTLSAFGGPELLLDVGFDRGRFEQATIDRMLGHLRTLLEGMATHPKARLSELPLLSEAERHRVLVEWNDTAKDYPKDRCIHELFEEQVKRTPDVVAVVFEDQQLSYQELNWRANQLAHHLRGFGVGPEVLVGICVERSLEMMVGLLGILKAGGAYVPLDPAYPKERLAFMMEDARVPILLTQERLIEGLPEHGAQMICLDTDWVDIAQESEGHPANGGTAENLAYVIYTSGSTGQPKGVAIGHRSAVTLLHWARDVFAPKQLAGVLASTSVCFDLSVFELFAPLSWGGKVILAKDALQLPGLPMAEKVTLINTVPSAMAELVRIGGVPESVRVVNLAGEPLQTVLVQQIYRQGGIDRVFDLYGPSEDTTYSTFVLRSGTGPTTIGRPVANTQVYLLDRNLQPVPIGVPGELHIAGAGLARGYLDRPELTAEKFAPNPFGDELGARLYKTGDRARYLPDGNIEFLGRVDHQVKLRGFRIELGEIEAVLGQHPAIGETMVVVREDIPSEKRLVAYVVANRQPTPSVGELRTYLKQKLPEYMVPSVFVALVALPLTPNGKVDRRALPAPDPSSFPAENAHAEPCTPVEEVLTGIWAEVLGLKQVGIHDDFFELGGHSLVAIQVVSRLCHAFRVELPLSSLFVEPTVAGLAERIEAARRAPQTLAAPLPLPVARDVQSLPVSFAQQRLWFLDQLEPNSPLYNLPRAVRVRGVLQEGALRRALGAIVERHEVLRTTFAVMDEGPVQVVAPTLSVPLPIEDLSTLTEKSEREAQASRRASEEAQRPFDLACGPLMRAKLLKLGEEEHVLLLTMHHIVSDGWSMDVFWRELAALYNAFSSDEPSPLAELPIQYADYAVWQRQWLQGEVLDRQLSYWKRQLADVPALELPTDYPRPAVQTHRGARQSLALPKSLTEALKELSRREGATLFMVLLAAFQVLLSRYSRQKDVAVGTPIAGRNRAETEGLIGFFVNTLVMRTDLSGDPTFRELLGRVREVALGAYDHQDLPFEKLVEELKPERDLSRSPLFQVCFNMLNVASSRAGLPGLRVKMFSYPDIESKFDLTLYAHERNDEIQLELIYNADLFEQARMAEMLAQLSSLLEQTVANPQQTIGSYSLLTPRSRSLLPDPKVALPEPRCEPITKTFLSWADSAPQKLAICQGNEAWSYAALARSARAIAEHLLVRGLERGDVVALLGRRSFGLIAGMVAVLLSRGAFLTIDRNIPLERQRLMLQEAGAKHLLFIGDRESEAEWAGEPPALSITSVDTGGVIKAQKTPSLEAIDLPEPAPDDPAYIFFTSGTTGTPKGILGCHKGLSHFLEWQRETFAVGPQDRVAQLTSLSFDALLRDVFLPLTSGATLCLPEEDNDLSADCVLPWLERERVSLLHTVPALAQSWLREPHAGVSLRALRWVFFSGEPLTDTLVHRWRRVFPKGDGIVNLYGPTETTMVKCFFRVGSCNHISPSVQPAGWPLPQTQALVLSPKEQMCGIGEPGEIVIRTPFRTLGYINADRENRKQFVSNPFRDEEDDLLYYTGDRGRYRTDGALEFLGRLDEQVKIRGVRVEPGEAEAVLGQHPAVRECVVVAQEEVPGGEPYESKRLVAYYVVPAGQQEPAPSELRGYLKEKLPEYMIPVAFVVLDALPLTPNGKVDRRALPAPDPLSFRTENAYAEPRTPVEEALAGIWEEVLAIERVSIHDDFFELGGHSLLATRVVSQLRGVLQVELPLRCLFETPTVAGLAERAEAIRRSDPAPSMITPGSDDLDEERL